MPQVGGRRVSHSRFGSIPAKMRGRCRATPGSDRLVPARRTGRSTDGSSPEDNPPPTAPSAVVALDQMRFASHDSCGSGC